MYRPVETYYGQRRDVWGVLLAARRSGRIGRRVRGPGGVDAMTLPELVQLVVHGNVVLTWQG